MMDGNTAVLYFENATATFCSFTAAKLLNFNKNINVKFKKTHKIKHDKINRGEKLCFI